METTWTLGILIGLPIAGVVTLAFAVLLVVSIRSRNRDPYEDWVIGIWIGAIGIALTLGMAGLLTIPWDAEYHQWRPVSGTVEEIGARMVRDGKGMSERYVLTIDGRPYGVDDTRAATLKVGDQVSLMCKREWQWAANSGYGCRWGADR